LKNSIGNVGKKTLISLTIPIFLELLLVTVVGNIDTIMLGYYSDEAVGAIGGITQLLNIQNVIFSFINMATAILTAQFLGAKDYKRVKQVISVSLVLNILLGVILGGIYLFFWKSLLQKINLPAELIGIGKYYFDESLGSIRDDYVYWLKILKKLDFAYANSEILAKYRIHAKSVTGKKYKMILPQFKVYYNIEKLGLMKSLYYLLYWSLHGIKKYYKKRMK